MLLSEYQNVLNQLILYISVNRDQVFHGFKILAGSDESYAGPTDFLDDQSVVCVIVYLWSYYILYSLIL